MITFTGFSFVRPLIFFLRDEVFFFLVFKRLVIGKVFFFFLWLLYQFFCQVSVFSTVVNASAGEEYILILGRKNLPVVIKKKTIHKGKRKSMTLKV